MVKKYEDGGVDTKNLSDQLPSDEENSFARFYAKDDLGGRTQNTSQENSNTVETAARAVQVPLAEHQQVSRHGKKWHDLNLKVKLEFRMEFKQRAARHNMSMVKLLYSAYKLWVETYDKDMPIMPGLLASDNDGTGN